MSCLYVGLNTSVRAVKVEQGKETLSENNYLLMAHVKDLWVTLKLLL